VSTPTLDKRALHCLDDVILRLDALNAKTKVATVQADLQWCIDRCQEEQEAFAGLVEVGIRIADMPQTQIQQAKARLEEVMMLEPGTPLHELLDGAATVIRYAAEGQEVPQ